MDGDLPAPSGAPRNSERARKSRSTSEPSKPKQASGYRTHREWICSDGGASFGGGSVTQNGHTRGITAIATMKHSALSGTPMRTKSRNLYPPIPYT